MTKTIDDINADFKASQLRLLSESIERNADDLCTIKSQEAQNSDGPRYIVNPRQRGVRTLKADDEHLMTIGQVLYHLQQWPLTQR